MRKKLLSSLRRKRWESHASKTLRYAQIQAWATVATAILTGCITGAASGIAFLQYQSTERQELLDLARSRPRYTALVEPRGRLGRGDEDVLLSNVLYVQLVGGEISGSKFKVEEFVRVSGQGATAEKPCLVRLAGYWNHAPISTEFVLEPDRDAWQIIQDGVFLASGKQVYLTAHRTSVEHHYRNVFQRDAVDVLRVDGSNVQVFTDGSKEKVPPAPSVDGHLIDLRQKGLAGFQLQIFDSLGDHRPLRDRLPEACRAVLTEFP